MSASTASRLVDPALAADVAPHIRLEDLASTDRSVPQFLQHPFSDLSGQGQQARSSREISTSSSHGKRWCRHDVSELRAVSKYTPHRWQHGGHDKSRKSNSAFNAPGMSFWISPVRAKRNTQSKRSGSLSKKRTPSSSRSTGISPSNLGATSRSADGLTGGIPLPLTWSCPQLPGTRSRATPLPKTRG